MSDNSPAIVRLIRKIPSAEYNAKDRCWDVGLHDDIFVRHLGEYLIERKLVGKVVNQDSLADINVFAENMPTLSKSYKLKLEPYDYQKKGIQYMVEHKRTFNGDDMGLGKEQPYSEPVLTPKGFVRMGSLKVGDEVIGADGKAAKVTNIFEQGIKDVYRVVFSDGTYARCGIDHLWSVTTPNWKRRDTGYKTMLLRDIIQDYFYEVTDRRDGKKRKNYKYFIPVNAPVNFKEQKSLPINSYVLGVLIGDGSLAGDRVMITKPNEDIRQAVVASIEGSGDVVGEFWADRLTYRISNNESHKTSHTKIALKELGLMGKKSVEKFIPSAYLFASEYDRRSLLQGLIDTDGHNVKDGFIEYSTASERLSEDVAFLARSLGYMVRVKQRESGYEKGGKLFKNYRIYIYGPQCRKKKAIVRIEKDGKELSRCIMVDNADHLYLTRDFIVTHNTMQSIAAIAVARAYPCLVVCPAAMKMTWKREFMKFIGKNATILDNDNKDTWQNMFITGTCNVFITNYESVKKFFVEEIKGTRITKKSIVLDRRAKLFKAVIIDESHRVKNSSCHYSKYLEAICEGKEYIFLLTGTPVVTNVKDLVQQLKIMGRIDDFGGATEFRNRFCGLNVTDEELGMLNSLLWRTCYFRREKSLVLKELPEKIRQYYSCELTNRKEYEHAEESLVHYLRKYRNTSEEKLKTAARNEAIVKIGILRQIAAEGKIQEAKRLIQDYLCAQKKVIVFTAHKNVAQKIHSAFPGSVTVTGDDSSERKQKAVDKFQNTEECRIIIVNIQSGGVGITLTAASDVLFVEMPWTAADCDQCECRAHRNGQKNAVTCVYLLGRNTFDERMYELVQKERSQSSIITGAVNDVQERRINNVMEYLNVV